MIAVREVASGLWLNCEEISGDVLRSNWQLAFFTTAAEAQGWVDDHRVCCLERFGVGAVELVALQPTVIKEVADGTN